MRLSESLADLTLMKLLTWFVSILEINTAPDMAPFQLKSIDIFLIFSQNNLLWVSFEAEVLQMSTHNISFCGKIRQEGQDGCVSLTGLSDKFKSTGLLVQEKKFSIQCRFSR